MATPVIMPKQGQSVETCIITSWFRKKGDAVKNGDILFSYETDKASFDVESPEDGILLDVFFGEGDEVPVLVNVAVIGSEGEETGSYRPAVETEKAPANEEMESHLISESQETGAPASDPVHGDEPRISPRAKKLAVDLSIDFRLLAGSGPNGRIIVRDIEEAGRRKTEDGRKVTEYHGIETGAPGLISDTGYEDQPLSNVRKIIAKAMHASLQNSAQLTHHMSADVRNLLETRKRIKEEFSGNINTQDITLNDMICMCVIRALLKFPEINSHFMGDKIRTFRNVNLGFAVDTKRGLMVPAIRNADTMDIARLSAEMKDIAEACRKGNVDPELLQGGAASFTVSNLGAYGVEMFTPVINLPQVAILGICTITHRPADLGNNIFGFIPVVGLSLTYDHRAIDGGPATLFLKEVKKQIEGFRM